MTPRIARILAATDFSAQASHAVKRSARIAHDARAELHLLWVAEERVADVFRRLLPAAQAAPAANAVAAVEERLAAAAAVLAEHYSIRAFGHVCTGEPHARIVETAARLGADLVALGAHGLHSYRELFFGSTASRVIRLAPQAVLVVRKPESVEYENVVAAVDFSPRSRAVVQWTCAIAPRAYVEVLHVIGSLPEEVLRAGGVPGAALEALRTYETDAARESMQRLLDEIGPGAPPLHPVIDHGNPAETVVSRAARLRRDLVVVGRRSGTSGAPTLLGSVARHAAEDVPADVLLTI